LIKVAIVGVSGYTGLELLKILLSHKKFEVAYLGASQEGEEIDNIHPSLKSLCELKVEKADAKEIAKKCELAFLALPHKASMGFAKELLELGVKVVDLSADYRLELETYEKFYCPHEDKEHIKDAVYGLPELYKEKLKDAKLVANPGCYPTATILGLLPFLEYVDESYPIMIDAKSGVSGAGKKCSEKTHYCSINENLFAYAPLSHRHEPEIKEKLFKSSEKEFDIAFVPHLLPTTRGMLVDSYCLLKSECEPIEILKEFYKNSPFIRVFENPVDIKSSSGTNFCDIYSKRVGKKLFISSSIDNLLRGASSQAVVNANLMYGFSEDEGIPKYAYVP